MKKIKLRDYQVKAIEEVRKNIIAGHKRIFVACATGSGKTTIISAIIRSACQRNSRTLVLAHLEEICYQFQDRLKLFGVNAGLIMSKEKGHPSRLCQVAMRQTVVNRKLPPANIVIIDEAHLVKGAQYMKLVEYYTNQGAIILYFSATPQRPDRKTLDDIAEVLVHPVKMVELIERGYLVDTKIYVPDVSIDTKGVRTTMGDYSRKDLFDRFDEEDIYEGIFRNANRIAPNTKTIACCCNIEHAENLADFFKAKGKNAVAIHSKKKNERKKIIEGVKNGYYDYTFQVDMLTQGFDAPILQTLLMCVSTKSIVRWMQMAGRVMRPFPGKDYGMIIDFGNCAERLIVPKYYDLNGLSLTPKPKKRGNKPAKECPKCHTVCMTTLRVCPECGHEFEKKIPDDLIFAHEVDFKEISDIGDLYMRINEINFNSLDDPRTSPREMLRTIAACRGYKAQWAAYAAVRMGYVNVAGYTHGKLKKKQIGQILAILEKAEKKKGTYGIYQKLKKLRNAESL